MKTRTEWPIQEYTVAGWGNRYDWIDYVIFETEAEAKKKLPELYTRNLGYVPKLRLIERTITEKVVKST